jgi:ankyrin repeat protein
LMGWLGCCWVTRALRANPTYDTISGIKNEATIMKKYLSKSIINSVINGDLDAVNKFLKWHAKDRELLNATEKDYKFSIFSFTQEPIASLKDTLTHHAVTYRKCDILRALVANDFVDVNKLNADGDTPLLIAVTYQQMDEVNILLANKKIDVNKANKQGRSPLLIAASGGNREIVEALLNHGANPRQASSVTPRNAIDEAEYYGHYDLAEFIRNFKPAESNTPRP